MRMPFFASFLIFIAWLTYEMRKADRTHKKIEKDFWDREASANSVRKKNIEYLPYIRIPEDLPFDICSDDESVRECSELVRGLSGERILNLTGLSNTELKLRYGAPNLPILDTCDQRFTLLVRTLQKWAHLLHERGDSENAKKLLEFAISVSSDVSASYYLLARIYTDEGNAGNIDRLITTAETLNTPMSSVIVQTLKEFCQ